MSDDIRNDPQFAEYLWELGGGARRVPKGTVFCGWFELRTQEGRTPLLIQAEGDKFYAYIGVQQFDRVVDTDFAERIFSYATKVIPSSVYDAVIEGRGWPEDRIVNGGASENPHADQPNEMPSPEIVFDEETRERTRALEAYLKEIGGEPKTQAHVDGIAAILEKARATHTGASEGKSKEKAPVLKLAKELEEKWAPVISRAKLLVDRCRDLTAKGLKAVRDAAEAERKAKLSEGEVVPETKVKAGGKSGGRALSLTKVYSWKLDDKVEDAADKVWNYVIRTKQFRENTLVRQAANDLVREILKAGGEIEGAVLVETETAR